MSDQMVPDFPSTNSSGWKHITEQYVTSHNSRSFIKCISSDNIVKLQKQDQEQKQKQKKSIKINDVRLTLPSH